jgi:hypothetical protein
MHRVHLIFLNDYLKYFITQQQSQTHTKTALYLYSIEQFCEGYTDLAEVGWMKLSENQVLLSQVSVSLSPHFKTLTKTYTYF